MLAAILVPGASAPASADVGWTSLAVASQDDPGLFPAFFDDGTYKVKLCTEGPPRCMNTLGVP
jgi:hypothetical protein